MIAIINGEIETMAGRTIPGGTVLIDGGRIAAVGKDVPIPEGAQRVDAGGRLVLPGMIDAAVGPMLRDPSINVVNLMADMDTPEEFEDPNEVKVVVDRNNDALYFSREPIPSRKKGADTVPMRKQVCIIPFRRDYLLRFNEMEESPLEICESVDMLRILEHGEKVRMVPTDARTWSVDTPEDLARVTRLMEGDALMREYAK